jgi:tetratricopeptide (TPR) repeat protein
LDCHRAEWSSALDHLERSLRLNADNFRARNLKALVLRKLNRPEEAQRIVAETLQLDPLDMWARHLSGKELSCDLQTRLDIAHDCSRAGLYAEGIAVLTKSRFEPGDLPDQSWGAMPLVRYTLGWLHAKAGNPRRAEAFRRQAQAEAPDYCFPARVEEIAVLDSALCANPRDPRAHYYLGNLLYDRRRHSEAISHWEKAATLEPAFSIVWRNLGIAYFNVAQDPAKAHAAYERAFRADTRCPRVLFERDQLWKRLGKAPTTRLRELEKHLDLVRQRDDLSLELCSLYNQTGKHAEVLDLLGSRRFQPWEGGEGGPLRQHVRSHLALGIHSLAADANSAREHFEQALLAPPNLGEARHLLANKSDIYYWLGEAWFKLNEPTKASDCWKRAAEFTGDFQEMSARSFSELTFYSALSMRKLGRQRESKKLLRELLAYARKLETSPAEIPYFATSLPAMLLFEDNLKARQETTALFLQAQAELGLGNRQRARALLNRVLKRDPNHEHAMDFLKSFRSE